MIKRKVIKVACLLLSFCFSACSFNPFISHHHETGSPTSAIIGAAIGAGSVGVLGGSKTLMLAAGLGGGAIGYYVSTLRFEAGGIMQTGGEVYQAGDYIGIYIPTDNMFEPNTAELLPQAKSILDSTVTVLKRHPDHHILISGHTSGFSDAKWEKELSLERAKQVAFYLWTVGIGNSTGNMGVTPKLYYIGYGDYFPIANRLTNKGIRTNSHIQITSYPTYLANESLGRGKHLFKD